MTSRPLKGKDDDDDDDDDLFYKGTPIPYYRNIMRCHLDLSFILNCVNLYTKQKFSNCDSHKYTVYFFTCACLKFCFKNVVTQNTIE
jgi:hypothetical protein